MIKASKSINNGKLRPPLSVEAREHQMINLAIDLAEKQLRDGTASSQVITHYLKLGSTKEILEKEILEEQKELVKARTKSYQSSEEIKQLYTDALKAMKSYSGNGDVSDDDYDDYDECDEYDE